MRRSNDWPMALGIHAFQLNNKFSGPYISLPFCHTVQMRIYTGSMYLDVYILDISACVCVFLFSVYNSSFSTQQFSF